MPEKRLIDKLDLRPDSAVVVLGVADPGFWAQLHERVTNVERTADATTDVVFYLADRREDLVEISTLRRTIHPRGTIWVVFPKGAARGGLAPRQADVLEAGRAAGLTDSKVVAFSATHSALKFVVPSSTRAAA